MGAGLSLASAIPFAGWGASAAKAGRKVVKASGEAAAKAAKEAAEKAAKEAAEKAEKEAAEKAAKEKGGKVKPKPKPKCGQSGPYKDRKDHDNDGMNWDHVPSQKALIDRAQRDAGRMLDPHEISAIVENAPTIAIPKGLHTEGSQTFWWTTASDGRRTATADQRFAGSPKGNQGKYRRHPECHRQT